MVSTELRNLETRLTFDKARRDKDEWDWWGNAVYVRGEGDLVHLASSLHHMDVQQNFVTITSRQLDAVLQDFYSFIDTGSPLEGVYSEDGTRSPIGDD